MAETPRKRRAPPKRTGPIRNAKATAPGAGDSPSANTATKVDDGLDLAVSDAVAHAVRLGYRVLAENLEEGRAAARQFRVGEYSVRDVPSDLNQLARRMVNLARDLSTTTFDLLDRALDDPNLAKAIRRLADAAPTAPAARGSGSDQSGSAPAGQPAPRAVRSKSGVAAPRVAAPPSPFVPLGCRFDGSAPARLLSGWLARPQTLSSLKTEGLTAFEPGAKPIMGITFQASDDGIGAVAVVSVPAGQAPGVYSGAVIGAESGAQLGTLTIQVGP